MSRLFYTNSEAVQNAMVWQINSVFTRADDTQLYLSFRPDDPTVDARISGCLADISAWMKEHHLQVNLAKTELLVFPATPTLQHDFTIQLGSSTITPSASVRNLGVIFDDQLTFKEHIAKTALSCRFALHNIRKIRPFLTEHAAQLLVQALVISRLDYCNALLAGLPSNTIKPLQMIQNAAARLVFNEPKRAHVTPLFWRFSTAWYGTVRYGTVHFWGVFHWVLYLVPDTFLVPLRSRFHRAVPLPKRDV